MLHKVRLPFNLTEREFEVLCLLAEGDTDREIAQKLVISVSTVHRHVEHILDKLDVRNRTQAVAKAIEHNLIDLSLGQVRMPAEVKELPKLSVLEFGLLNDLFGPGSQEPTIVTAEERFHGLWPLEIGGLAYSNDREAGKAYLQRFSLDGKPRPAHDLREGLVLFGSEASNELTSSLLGPPSNLQDRFAFMIVDPHNRWQTTLHWKRFIPMDASIAEFEQYGAVVKEREDQIMHYDSAESYKTRYDIVSSGKSLQAPRDDYLLISSLPRYSRRGIARTLIFSGLHGLGTRAMANILTAPPISLLEKVAAKIGRHQPYFQALFYVPILLDQHGESVPGPVQLIFAAALDVRFN